MKESWLGLHPNYETYAAPLLSRGLFRGYFGYQNTVVKAFVDKATGALDYALDYLDSIA